MSAKSHSPFLLLISLKFAFSSLIFAKTNFPFKSGNNSKNAAVFFIEYAMFRGFSGWDILMSFTVMPSITEYDIFPNSNFLENCFSNAADRFSTIFLDAKRAPK